jgi:hypothetical protein
MPSFQQALWIGYLICAIQIWLLVFKKPAYSETPLHLKWIHALVLFYVIKNAFYSFFAIFLWLCSNPRQFINCLQSQPNQIGDMSLGIAGVIAGFTGIFLMAICYQMAKRDLKSKKWYFLLWPLNFITLHYITICRQESQHMIPIIVESVFLFCIFVFTISFYLQNSTKIFFNEKISATE